MTNLPPEGDAFSKLNALFTEGTSAADRAAKIELATVTSSAPNLEIKLDADGLALGKESLVISEHLTKHKRIMTMRKCSDGRFSSDYPRSFDTNIRIASTAVDEDMSIEGYIPHTHDISMLGLNAVQDDFTAVDIEVEYQDELRKGDRVLVACLDADMTYIILDRARWY